jgi:hypothetical protein
MQKTPLAIPEMKCSMPMKINANPSAIQLIETNEDTYYFHLTKRDLRDINTPDSHSIILVNKYLTTIEKKTFWMDSTNSFLEILSNENQIIVLTKEIKTGYSISIVRRIYSKKDLSLISKAEMVTFRIVKSNPANFYAVKSPDKSKVGLLGLIAKNGIFNDYFVAIVNNSGEIIWEKKEDLALDNKPFAVEDITLSNNGQMVLAFHSRPQKEETGNDKKSDLNIVFFEENTKNNLHLPFENNLEDVKLHVLKNDNIFIAGILRLSAEGHLFQYFNKIVSKHDLEVIGEDSQKINFARNDFLYEVNPSPKIFNFTVNIHNISQLKNDDIAVLCEQVSDVTIKSDVLYRYLKTRGNVVSFLVENDGVIKSKNEIEKFQQQMGNLDMSPHLLHVSVLPFAYENKTGYLFNDAIKNYETLSPPKEKIPFNRKYGRDSGIYMIIEEDGDLSKTIALTGIDPAKRFLCELLAVEEDRAIILTRDKKSAYIEIVPLP